MSLSEFLDYVRVWTYVNVIYSYLPHRIYLYSNNGVTYDFGNMPMCWEWRGRTIWQSAEYEKAMAK